MRPQPGSYPSYFDNYIPLIKEGNVLDALKENSLIIRKAIRGISGEKENYRYAERKWTSKQLVSHIIDTERILAYRALRFARKDPQQPLPFSEDDYAANAELSHRTIADMLEEFDSVRTASQTLFKSFTPQSLLFKGNTAIGETTPLAIGFMICGHGLHHINVLQERYLKNYSQIKI